MMLAYDPGMSERWSGTATPFDTGGLIGHIEATGLPGSTLAPEKQRTAAGLSDEETAEVRAYLQAHLIRDLSQWPERFDAFLKTYYNSPASYVLGERPNLSADEETNRHRNNTDRRAWTWEIQAHRDHDLFEGLWLLRMSSELEELLLTALADSGDSRWSVLLRDASIYEKAPVDDQATHVGLRAQKEIASWV